MRRLAQQAQVSTRTLYNLYGAKEDILFALMCEAMASIDEIFQAGSESDPLGRSRAVTTRSVDRLCEREDLYRNLLRTAEIDPGRAREPLLMAKMRSMHEAAIQEAVRVGQLEPGFSPRVLAHHVVLSYGQGVRLWAHGVFDQSALRAHVLYKWAIQLLAFASEESRQRLREDVLSVQDQIASTIASFDRIFEPTADLDSLLAVSESGVLAPAVGAAWAGSR